MWRAHRALLARTPIVRGARSRVRREADAVLLMWDELRARMRAGNRRGAAATAAAIMRDPAKGRSVARLLVERRRIRRRSAAYRAACGV